MLSIVENAASSVPVELGQSPAAYPEPTVYTWNKDGEPLSSGPGRTLTYSSITFSPVTRSNAGNYMVSTTNYILGSNTEQVGNDTGSFFINVICKLQLENSLVYNFSSESLFLYVFPDGPSFQELGPTQQYVLLGESLSLVCGTGLDSNPDAMVTWTASDDTTITTDTSRYTLDNGPDVRLTFSQTILTDTGMWVCDVRVITGHNAVSNGSFVSVDPALIGVPITHSIQLTVIGEYFVMVLSVCLGVN